MLQQDLADELAKEGVTISYKAISNWERNLAEPSVTIFYKVCRILGITNMYEAYFGVNPADPFSSLTDEGREKAMDYINLLHASGMYEKTPTVFSEPQVDNVYADLPDFGSDTVFAVGRPRRLPCRVWRAGFRRRHRRPRIARRARSRGCYNICRHRSSATYNTFCICVWTDALNTYGQGCPFNGKCIKAVTLFGGMQLLCLGIIGEYLAKAYLETKRRPIYIIRESNEESDDSF